MITITCPFSGKLFCLDEVLKRLYDLHVSGYVRGVFLDNSGDDRLRKKLREFQSSRVWDEVMIIEEPKGSFDEISAIYNRFQPHVQGLWFSVEDDVLLEPDTLRKLQSVAFSNYDVGVVSAFMDSRRGWKGPLAWMVEEDERGDPILKEVAPRSYGSSPVDATHTGCTLIKQCAYLDYEFRQFGPTHRLIGHDINLCRDSFHHRGLRTMVRWDVRVGHCSTNGTYFPETPPHLSFLPLLRDGVPRVSVITPTHPGRVTKVQKLIDQLQKQTHVEFEVLVCSDGPDRDTASVVTQAMDPRFNYYELEHRHGYWGAYQRNLMIQKAAGDLLCFVDSDVEIEDFYLDTMVRMWKQGFQMGFAQVDLTEHDGSNWILPVSKEVCTKATHVDSLCGFVDAGIGKAFFWDVAGDSHDHRYFQQISSYLRGRYGFTQKVVGRIRRGMGRTQLPNDKHEMSVQIPEAELNLTPMNVVSLLQGRPHLMEKMKKQILSDPAACLSYATNVLGGPFPEGEPVIAKNVQTAVFYAVNVLKDRFLLAESLFLDQPFAAVQYAKFLGLRWDELDPEVEKSILGEPFAAAQYAAEVLKAPWPEAEPFIQTNTSARNLYDQKVLKKRHSRLRPLGI